MLTRFVLASASILGVLSLSAACSSSDPGTGGDDLTSAPIPPAPLLDCWVKADTSTTDAFFQAHDVVCAAKAPATYPRKPERFIVEYRTARQRVGSAVFAGGENRIGRVANDDFPLTIQARIMMPSAPEYGQGYTLKRELKVDTLASATPAQPLTLKSPFTLWPVELKNTSSQRFFVTGRYTVATSPYKVGSNFNIPDNDPESLTPELFLDSVGTELALIAPLTGAIDVQVNGTPGKIDGPGTYVFDGTKLTKEDASVPPPPVDPPTPVPTCGTAGQAPCAGNVCAPKHRLEGAVCIACGSDAQPACRDASGNPACSAGHRYDSNDAKCHACGSDGQTFCRDAGGNPSCNAGHRYDSNDSKCRACGSDGQTFCRDAGGNPSCNGGHRYDPSDSKCHICGANGQTFCRDASGNPVCTIGHRYDSSDSKCHVCGGEGQTFCRDAVGNPVCSPGLRYDASSSTCKR